MATRGKDRDRPAHHAETLSPVLPSDIEEAAADLLERGCNAGLMFTTAESCTGGLIASLLTDVEGASRAFDRGFVVYSEAAKCDLLGIARETIKHCGAVSRDVARAMARGAVENSQADIVLAVTGFAGPAAPGDEPGLVHFTCARRGGKAIDREEHFGDIGRGPIRIACLRVALEMMRDAI